MARNRGGRSRRAPRRCPRRPVATAGRRGRRPARPQPPQRHRPRRRGARRRRPRLADDRPRRRAAAGAAALVRAVAGPRRAAAGARHLRRPSEATLAFDPTDSDLPQLASFPRLVANLVAWSQEWAPAVVTARQPFLALRPPGAGPTQVVDASGDSRPRAGPSSSPGRASTRCAARALGAAAPGRSPRRRPRPAVAAAPVALTAPPAANAEPTPISGPGCWRRARRAPGPARPSALASARAAGSSWRREASRPRPPRRRPAPTEVRGSRAADHGAGATFGRRHRLGAATERRWTSEAGACSPAPGSSNSAAAISETAVRDAGLDDPPRRPRRRPRRRTPERRRRHGASASARSRGVEIDAVALPEGGRDAAVTRSMFRPSRVPATAADPTDVGATVAARATVSLREDGRPRGHAASPPRRRRQPLPAFAQRPRRRSSHSLPGDRADAGRRSARQRLARRHPAGPSAATRPRRRAGRVAPAGDPARRRDPGQHHDCRRPPHPPRGARRAMTPSPSTTSPARN